MSELPTLKLPWPRTWALHAKGARAVPHQLVVAAGNGAGGEEGEGGEGGGELHFWVMVLAGMWWGCWLSGLRLGDGAGWPVVMVPCLCFGDVLVFLKSCDGDDLNDAG